MGWRETNACTSVDRFTVLAFVWPAPPTLGERAKVQECCV